MAQEFIFGLWHIWSQTHMVPGHLVPHNWSPIDWSLWTNGPQPIQSPWTNGPQKFGLRGQMVPNQFGPHGQMVPRIFHLSRGTGCGDPEIRASNGIGTKWVAVESGCSIIHGISLKAVGHFKLSFRSLLFIYTAQTFRNWLQRKTDVLSSLLII